MWSMGSYSQFNVILLVSIVSRGPLSWDVNQSLKASFLIQKILVSCSTFNEILLVSIFPRICGVLRFQSKLKSIVFDSEDPGLSQYIQCNIISQYSSKKSACLEISIQAWKHCFLFRWTRPLPYIQCNITSPYSSKNLWCLTFNVILLYKYCSQST